MNIRRLLFLLLILEPSLSFPCTCVGPYSAKNMRDAAAWYAVQPDVGLIFEGTVVRQEVYEGPAQGPSNAMSMSGAGHFRKFTFAVEKTYRGPGSGEISIVTGAGVGDCGYGFEPGNGYLVFATPGPGGLWFTSICTGTEPVEDAGTALRYIRGEKPTAEDNMSPEEHAKWFLSEVLPKRTGGVCGTVLKPDGTPLRGAGVDLWQVRQDDLPPNQFSDPNTTDSTGHFCIKYAEPGSYLLTAEDDDFDRLARDSAYYPGVHSPEKAVPLEIKAGVQLPDVKLRTVREQLYSIAIMLQTPDGTTLSYKNGCGVAVDSVYHDPLSYHISGLLDEDGRTSFGYIPLGKYVVTTYFEPDYSGAELKPYAEASRWKPARYEITVYGDTEVRIHMEPVKSTAADEH